MTHTQQFFHLLTFNKGLIKENMSMQSLAKARVQARQNPYVCTAVKGNIKGSWSKLPEDLQDQILRKARLRFVYERDCERQVPLTLRAAPLSREELEDRDLMYSRAAQTIQRLVIKRSRASIEDPLSNQLDDTMTVNFSERVIKNDINRERFNRWGFDMNAVCDGMDFKLTWTDVIKIRLVFGETEFDLRYNFVLALTRRGNHGSEEVVFVRRDVSGRENVVLPVSNFILFGRENKDAFAQRLANELDLRHRVVAGCDEFTVG